MALPIWGLFMKKCYADKDLDVSKEEFEKPSELSIRVNCNEVPSPTTFTDDEEDLNDIIDF
jgi:penicillin-binding protein 1A